MRKLRHTLPPDQTRPNESCTPTGCTKIYSEKVSGALGATAPQLAKLLKRLDQGDVLIVTRLDRLARSTRDLLNILDALGKAGAGFKSLSDAWANTTTPHGRLMLTVLGGLAEFERELIIARTGEGRTRAKAPWREIRATGSSNAASTRGPNREGTQFASTLGTGPAG
jgi:DNA invertase Pin-like site-specific DNA recombinase